MLQIKSRWNVPLERLRSLRVSGPRRESVFGYDARDTWRITLDGVDWGRAEEWETERPPVREGRDLLVQVFPGHREAVLAVLRAQGTFRFRQGEQTLGCLEPERLGLRGRARSLRCGERGWASLRATGEDYQLEGHWGAPFARFAIATDAVSATLSAGAVPEAGVSPLDARLLVLAVSLSFAVDLPVVTGDWRQA